MGTDRDSEKRLGSAAQFTSLAEYLKLFTHEVNNPLSVIYGEAYQLRRRLSEGPIESREVERVAESLEALSLRIMGLVQDLRFALRPGTQEAVESFTVGRWVELALKYTRRDLEISDVTVDLSGVQKDVELRGRPMQMARALWNVIRNALDSLQRMDSGRRLRIWSARGGGGVTLNVSDNGPGVGPEISGRLFEPFVSTRPDAPGLGLFAARSWLEQNGARIDWTAGDGETTFSLHVKASG